MPFDHSILLCISSSCSWLLAHPAIIEALIEEMVELLRIAPKAQRAKTSTSCE